MKREKWITGFRNDLHVGMVNIKTTLYRNAYASFLLGSWTVRVLRNMGHGMRWKKMATAKTLLKALSKAGLR